MTNKHKILLHNYLPRCSAVQLSSLAVTYVQLAGCIRYLEYAKVASATTEISYSKRLKYRLVVFSFNRNNVSVHTQCYPKGRYIYIYMYIYIFDMPIHAC